MPTQVPSSGYIEKLYFNTNLSVEETNNLLNELVLTNISTDASNVVNGYSPLYTVDNDVLYLFQDSYSPTEYYIRYAPNMDFENEITIFRGVARTNMELGWFVDELPINKEVITNKMFELFGTFNQNDKLANLISTTPFENQVIKELSGDYEAVNIVLNELPSGWKGTQVPNSGTVEKVYFNTNLTVDEVKSILDQLTYIQTEESEWHYYILLDSATTYILDISYTNAETKNYLIMGMNMTSGEMVQYFNTDNNGWLEVANTPLELNMEVMNGESVGAENDKLTTLISTTPFEEPIALKPFLEGIADAIREKKKTTELINAQNFRSEILSIQGGVNVVKSGGTVVPSSGMVENVYLNSKYITDNPSEEALKELYDILSSIQYISYSNMLIYALVSNADMTYGLSIGKAINNTSGVIKELYNIIYTNNNNTIEYLLIQKNLNTGDIVYNYNFDKIEDLSNVISFNFENQVSVLAEQLGGTLQNEKLTQLFSSTPFESKTIKTLEGDYKVVDIVVNENKTVDVETYLDNKQMPLSVKVNIGSTNIVSQDGEIIKTLKGDYEAINLTFNEPPNFWQETVFVNGNYVEKLYFNTELTTDEIDAIFSTLTYDDNSHLITQYATAEAGRSGSIYIIKIETNGLNGYTIRISNFDGDSYIYASNQETVEYIRKNFNKTIKVGLNITEFPINNTIHSVSNEISNLTNLISSKPLLKNTINVESYLDNKQMPLEIKLNVESQEPNLQEKEITENGEYVADEGYDGFSKVTVNVAGEDMLQARVDATNSCEYLFYQYKGDNVDFIKDLDTSNVTNMSSMFNGCSMLKTIPQLDTSNVTNMISMFRDCSALETIPQLDMIKSTNRSQMFYNCSKLTNLTLLNIKAYIDLSQNEKLTLESLINTVKEFINVGSARILTMGTANLEKIASTYVKFTDSSLTTIPTNEKGDVVVCESTDTGAMLLKDYALLKNWTLA